MLKKKRIVKKARNRFLEKKELNSSLSNLTIRELFLLEKELGFKIAIDND
ncbi:hypothetical protein [Salegentibacter salegens]|uniref:Uncharacterized protein n=1 Tax=Salegentibacter salegens TaxID=143223 RepID=A0A1M7L8Q5_9FLAO|nr:hypothetical protein [Salegentibacter salegens]PRX40776.1 hypothetical protein LY58_03105 [Salegentibacter salegens]SHM74309.1 hypothetical protein SAMN05878281_1796 [Salegentibacter salegens]